MPASTVDVIDTALKASLFKNRDNVERQLAASTKRSLLAVLDFEEVKNYQISVVDNLKSKYIVLKAPENQQNGSKPPERKPAAPNRQEETLQLAKYELYPSNKIQLGWSNISDWSVGTGMMNMGNTCYLNSTLQALFHVPSLVNWLMSDKEHSSECSDTGVCIICAMRKTLLESQQRNLNSIRPLLIYNKLRLVCRNLIPGRQEDAHEFLRYLVEAMEKSYLRRFKNFNQFDSKVKETTPLNQILGGYLRSSVRCLSCGHVSTTFQHFQDLLLDIRKPQTVEEALDLYFCREKLDDESYHCEACKKYVHATKQFQLERAPMVLCIQLKRFSISNNKLTKHVGFRQRLDLTKYARKRANSLPLNYRLVSLVTHMGPTVNCGHYTAIAQAPSGNYYQFDDSMVKPVALQTVFTNGAYIMLYELEPSSRYVAKPSSVQTGMKSKASSTIITEQCVTTSNGLRLDSGKQENGQNGKAATAPKVPLGVGFTSDKMYGPELPPDRQNVTSSLANGRAKVVSSSTSLSPNLTEESSTESSEDDELKPTSLTQKKEADSSSTNNNNRRKTMDNSGLSRDGSPTSSSASTSISSLSGADVGAPKKMQPSKSLVPYETGDTSSSDDSSHAESNRIQTKVTMGEWQVTSSTDITPQKWDSRKTSNGQVVNELYKMSTAGYSAPVTTWNGTRSQLDKEVQQERREDRKRLADSSGDQGHGGKQAKISTNFGKGKSNPGYNPVQEYHNAKNWNNANGSPGNGYHHNHKPYYHGNRHKRNFHHGKGGFHKNNYRFR